jgi:hypothetical protein
MRTFQVSQRSEIGLGNRMQSGGPSTPLGATAHPFQQATQLPPAASPVVTVTYSPRLSARMPAIPVSAEPAANDQARQQLHLQLLDHLHLHGRLHDHGVTRHPHREHIEIASMLIAAAVLIGVEAASAVSHAEPTTASRPPAAVAQATIESSSVTAASATAPAVRSRARVSVPTTKMPTELMLSISAQVSAVQGCTHTTIGDTVVTAAHCHQPGFTVAGDIAWSGPDPSWTDAAAIPMGATIYAVGYPQATPGAQGFSLANLGVRTITIEQQPVEVLMTEGTGVACSNGASGMIGWVTIDETMVPIGPLSVFAVDPAITGLPAGQFVCGFATT